MVRQICQQTPEDEVFGSRVERRAHKNQDKLCDEDVDSLHIVDRDAAADKAGYPYGCGPSEGKAVLLLELLAYGLAEVADWRQSMPV